MKLVFLEFLNLVGVLQNNKGEKMSDTVYYYCHRNKISITRNIVKGIKPFRKCPVCGHAENKKSILKVAKEEFNKKDLKKILKWL